MNTAKAAAEMMAQANSRNISFDALVDSALFLKNDPMVAPQKDGRYSLIRVYRGEDQAVRDLDFDTAQTLLAEWLGDVVLAMPSPKDEARWQASLAERGWND